MSDIDKTGLFVYRALHDVGVRDKPTVCDSHSTPQTVEAGELVCVDLWRTFNHTINESGNGPFLRLAGSDSWIFEYKEGSKCMEAIPVEEGYWSYQVTNSFGLVLRRHPTHSTECCLYPEVACPGKSLVWVDRKVQCGGVTYVRVKDTSGWLFMSRNGQQTLRRVVVEEGSWMYQVINSAGLALRGHPDDSSASCVDPEIVFPDGSLVSTDKKVECGGTTYVRVKDTSGWLFLSLNGQQTLRRVIVEEGSWTYQVTNFAGLGLLRHPAHAIVNRMVAEETYPDGSLVQADRKVECGGITFVHVKDTSGWLFMSRSGVNTLRRVVEEEGVWTYKVTNKVGLALRRNPTHSPESCLVPEVLIPNHSLVRADKKVECGVDTFVRVSDTLGTGWLFVSRDGEQTLIEQKPQPIGQ
eukprot:gene13175-15562_t